MKRYLPYILAGTGTLILGMLIGLYFFFQAPLTAWNFVPQNAMLVLETTDLPLAYQDLKQKKFWKNVQTAPYFNVLQSRFEFFMKTVGQASANLSFWKERRVVLSLHWVGKEDFDALFYVPLTAEGDKQVYEQTLGRIAQNKAFKLTQRTLGSQNITEITIIESDEKFTYTLCKDYFIGSYSSVLLEDAVRKISTGEPSYTFGQASVLKNTLTKSELSATHCELYLNLPRLADGVAKLLPEALRQDVEHIAEWGAQSYLRLQTKNELAWEGFTLTDQKADKPNGIEFLRTQKNTGSSFQVASLIPQNAYLAYATQIDDARAWVGKEGDLSAVLEQIKGNFTLAHLTNEGKQEGTLLILRPDKPLSLLSAVQNYIRQHAKSALPAPEREQVGKYGLQEIAGWETLRKAFAQKMFNPFEQAYFAVLGQYIVIGNDRYMMRQYLQDYQDQKTWETLPTYAQIAPTLKKSSKFTVLAHLPTLWSRSYEWVTPKFQMLLGIYENQLNSLSWFVWQNQVGEELIQTQASIFTETALPPPAIEDTTKGNYKVLAQVNFGDLLYTQPFLVKNAETGATEILVQDFRKVLYLLNEKGIVLWRRAMNGLMVGAPTQIDIYNNNRLQYVWHEGIKLHLIDKLGRNVPAFPVSMTDTVSNLQGISILNPERNKNYLFAACDERGRLFVLSNKVQWVQGWNPKRLAYRLGTPLQAVRVKNDNYFIALQENGQIHAFNAKGETLAGFPITTKQRFTAQMHIEPSNSLISTRITTISEEGKLIQFNLEGKMLKEKQLHRPSGRAKFALLQDERGDNFWFAVSTESYWQLMDREGEMLMEETEDRNAGKWDIQLLEPIAKSHIVAVTNRGEARTTLYDLRGKMVGEPFQSNAPVALRYDAKARQMLIYRVLGNKLAVLAKAWER